MSELPRPYKRSDPPSLPGSDRVYLDGELRRIEQSLAGTIEYLSTFDNPKFSAHNNSVNQSATGSAYYKVTFSTEDFDIGGYYDTSTSRFQPPAGIYRIKAQITVLSSVGSGVVLRKNGVTDVKSFWAPTVSAQNIYIAVEGLLELDGTDYVEVYSFIYDATAKNISGASEASWFEAEKVQ